MLEARTVPSFVTAARFYAGGENGTGTTLPGGADQMAVGDFNNDGKLGVVAEDFVRQNLYVTLGNGDSTFRSPLVIPNENLANLVTGDFNGDGNLDLAALDLNNGGSAVFFGKGDGTFQAPVHESWKYAPASLLVGDFNGDGKLDLAVGGLSGNTAYVGVFLGNGDGTFQAPVTTAVPGMQYGGFLEAAADFNKDGKLDLVVSSGNDDSNHVPQLSATVLLGKGDGTFTIGATLATGTSGGIGAAGDLNGDGIPDLVVPDRGNSVYRVFLGKGDGTFQPPLVTTTPFVPFSAKLADLNGDGKLDMLLFNVTASSRMTVYLGNGDGTFTQRDTYSDAADTWFGGMGDFDGDGKLDIVMAGKSITTPTGLFSASLWLGNGDGTFQALRVFSSMPTTIPPANGTVTVNSYGTQAVALGDFNGDGNLDAVVPAFFRVNNGTDAVPTPVVNLQKGNGDGTFQSPYQTLPLPAEGVYVTVADFNGDSHPDFAVEDSAGNVSVALNKGDGTFQNPFIVFTDTSVNTALSFPVNQSPVVGDFNGDGIPDLAVATQGNGVAVLLGKGDGTFQKPVFYPASRYIDGIVVADFNGDGHLDIATANGGGNLPVVPADITILYDNGDGTFQPPVAYSYWPGDNPPFPASLAVGDFNGDGRPDLVLTEVGHQLPVTVMLNNGDGSFQVVQGPLVEGGVPVVGDFNHDGHLDVAYAAASIPLNIDEVASLVLYGNGDGTFQTPVVLAMGEEAGIAAAGGLNHSGLPSIVIAQGSDFLADNPNPSIAVLLNAPDAVKLRIGPPDLTASVTAGVPFPVTVDAVESSGKVVSTYRNQVAFSSSSAGSLPSGTITHGTRIFQATLTTAGPQSLTVTDANGLTVTTSPITVAPAAADHFAISMPAQAGGGDSVAVTVTALDRFGNRATSYAGQVHFASSDGAAVLPPNAGLVNGTGTFHVIFYKVGTQTLTATDTSQASLTGTGSILIPYGQLDHFTITAPAQALAGEAAPLTVSARDAQENLILTYSGPVVFSSTDAAAVLPANAALSGGTGNFSVILRSQGDQTVSVSDGAATPHTGASLLHVNPASAFHYQISVPAAVTAGAAFNATVTVLDDADNPFTAYTGTVHFGSSDPSAVLPADATLVNGAGTFSVTLKKTGAATITTLDVAESALNGSSPAVNVAAAALDHFGVSLPNSAVAGTSSTMTVTALDAFSNIVTGYNGTVRFFSTDPAAVLPGITSLAGGLGTFAVTLRTAGIQTVTASDTNQNTLLGVSVNVSVAPAAASRLRLQSASTTTAGSNLAVTVIALDPFGNTATGYTGTVNLTSSDPAAAGSSATLPGGVGVLNVALRTAGAQTLTITDAAQPSLTISSPKITVSPAAVSQFRLDVPAAGTAGATLAVTVTARDPYGNLVPGFTGPVHFSSSDPNAVLPADAPLSSGAGQFNISLHTAGAEQVTVSDPSQATRQGSGSVAVAPAAASRFTLSAPGGDAAGSAFPVSVTALDPFGNVATSYSGKIHFTSTDVQAVLPADSSLSSGTGVATVTLRTAAAQTVTGTDVSQNSITGISGGVAVTPLAATHLGFALAGGISAGTAVSVTVAALDPFGNVAVSYGGVVHFSSTDPAAQLPAAAALVNGSGTFTLTLRTLGTQSVSVADSGSFTATATTLSNQPFVAQVYHDLLRRQADAVGMVAFGTAFLQGQQSPAQIVSALLGSKEYRSGVVQHLYSQLLLRSADPGGLQGWVTFLANGGSDEQVEAALLGSTEYFNKRASGTTAGFLDAVYRDIFGRDVDSGGLASWTRQMQNGLTRSQVASAILAAPESEQDRVQNWYALYLHRSADAAGLAAFTSNLQQGVADEQVILALLSSREYLNKVR
jgi:hypothetical protein